MENKMYKYEQIKPKIFTEEGQLMFLRIRDKVLHTIAHSGAISMDIAISNCGGGDAWTMLACVDRLVELKEIEEVTTNSPGQYRIFTKYN
jgi:hypothetical protein